MIEVVKTLYDMKAAMEKEFGEVTIFRFQWTESTPPNNMEIEVFNNGMIYPFLVDDSDFEDVPLLIEFMITHIKSQVKLRELKGEDDNDEGQTHICH